MVKTKSDKKVAVLSGASRRLGLFLTHKLLKEGWHVHAITRSGSEELQKLTSSELTLYCLDSYGPGAYCEANIRACSDQIVSKESRIDLLVNNASIFESDQAVAERRWSAFSEMFFIHMQLPAMLIESMAESLFNVERPGNVISVTDIYAENPNEDFALYCSTKAGLENLAKSYAKKLAPGVRVNTIRPGPIKFLPEHDVGHQQGVLKETLLAVEGGFMPIYQTLNFILDNHYLTGASIPVDGGRSLVRG